MQGIEELGEDTRSIATEQSCMVGEKSWLSLPLVAHRTYRTPLLDDSPRIPLADACCVSILGLLLGIPSLVRTLDCTGLASVR